MAYLGVVAEDELQDARLSKTLGLWNEVDLVASLELLLEVIASCAGNIRDEQKSLWPRCHGRILTNNLAQHFAGQECKDRRPQNRIGNWTPKACALTVYIFLQ